MFTLGEIARIVGGRLIGRPEPTPLRVVHDSRLVEKGDLFVALPGRRRDGHEFLGDAFERGAIGGIVSREGGGGDLIVVPDPLAALQRLAGEWRDRIDSPIIAITGSNGKTTTKDLLAHILRGRMRAFSSPSNYNTEIGLPLSLLRMGAEDEIGVFELASQAPGEISFLAELLRPSGAVITGIGPSHLSSFKTLEAVADEKWSLVRSIPEGGLIVVNADSPHLRSRATPGVVTAGLGYGRIRGRIVQETPHLTVEIDSPRITLKPPLLGRHNATNLLLAAACALELGIPPDTIAERVSTFNPRPHRLRPVEARFGTILDDTYNANPSSTLAAIHVLDRYGNPDSKRIFVFGEMLDLGEESERYHRSIVEEALKLRIDLIFPLGDRPVEACRRLGSARAVISPPDRLVATIKAALDRADNVVLVKGSRDLKLERIVDALKRI